MNTLKHTRGRYLMVLIAMSGLVASAIGIVTNTAGIFFGPIAQELGLGERITAVSLTLTLSNLVFALGGMLVARVIHTRNFRAMIVGFTMVLVGATAALSLSRGLFSLYALNVLRGFAAGIISNVLATTVICEWFRTDTGLISSLVLGCSGLIGALLNPVFEAVIRASGWRAAYLASAAVMLALNLPAMLLPIAMRPHEVGMQALSVEASGDRRAPVQARTSLNSDSRAVLPLTVVMFSIVGFVVAIPQLFKPIAKTYGLEATGVTMMSIVLVVNTGGKLLFGAMTDRLGVKHSLLIYGTAIFTGLLLLTLVRVPAAMLLSAALIGLSYSIPTVGAVMICRELFSPERYSRVFPTINLGVTVLNALGYPLLSAIHGATGSYAPALWLSAALVLISMTCVPVVYRLAQRKC